VFAVDTNVLISAAIRETQAHHRAKELISKWGSAPEEWVVTWSIVYEFLRIATHVSVFTHPLAFAEAWSFMESLFRSPSFSVLTETDRHAAVVRDLTREYPHLSGNRLHDLHIAALMREHGVMEIRTTDLGFHQFKFLRVVNPL
jgi:toxin-antitoxin system PIN domain toxin